MSPYRESAGAEAPAWKRRYLPDTAVAGAVFLLSVVVVGAAFTPATPKPCTERLVSHRDDRGFVTVDSEEACHPDARLAFVNEAATQWVICTCGVGK